MFLEFTPHFNVNRQRTARVAAATASGDSSTYCYFLRASNSSANGATVFAIPAFSAPLLSRTIAPAQLLKLRAFLSAATPRPPGFVPSSSPPPRLFHLTATTAFLAWRACYRVSLCHPQLNSISFTFGVDTDIHFSAANSAIAACSALPSRYGSEPFRLPALGIDCACSHRCGVIPAVCAAVVCVRSQFYS